MSGFDIGVLSLLALSAVVGMVRGLFSELLGLGAWVLAYFSAAALSAPVASALPESWGEPTARLMIACVMVFVGALIVCGVVRRLMRSLLRAAGLGAVDRGLGALFGLARGLLIVVALALAAGLTTLPRQPWWRAARLALPIETAALAVKAYLPAGLASRIRFR